MDADLFDTASSSDDSDAVDSEVEFELYSQIHYRFSEADIVAPNDSSLEAQKLTPTSDTLLKDAAGDMASASKAEILPPKHGSTDDILESDQSDVEEWELVNSKSNAYDEIKKNHNGLDIHLTMTKRSAVRDSEENEIGECWDVIAKDAFGTMDQKRYFGASRIRCKNCDDTGHVFYECPKPKKLRPCYLCGRVSHQAWQCDNSFQPGRQTFNNKCSRCGYLGHKKKYCPDKWRQYHLTVGAGCLVTSRLPNKLNPKKNCFICHRHGHFAHECRKSKYKQRLSFAPPLVFKYDREIYSEQKNLPSSSLNPVNPSPNWSKMQTQECSSNTSVRRKRKQIIPKNDTKKLKIDAGRNNPTIDNKVKRKPQYGKTNDTMNTESLNAKEATPATVTKIKKNNKDTIFRCSEQIEKLADLPKSAKKKFVKKKRMSDKPQQSDKKYARLKEDTKETKASIGNNCSDSGVSTSDLKSCDKNRFINGKVFKKKNKLKGKKLKNAMTETFGFVTKVFSNFNKNVGEMPI